MKATIEQYGEPGKRQVVDTYIRPGMYVLQEEGEFPGGCGVIVRPLYELEDLPEDARVWIDRRDLCIILKSLVDTGRKITAIKLVRAYDHRMGLKETKDFIESEFYKEG